MRIFETYPPSSLIVALVLAVALLVGGAHGVVVVALVLAVGYAARWLDTKGGHPRGRRVL